MKQFGVTSADHGGGKRRGHELSRSRLGKIRIKLKNLPNQLTLSVRHASFDLGESPSRFVL